MTPSDVMANGCMSGRARSPSRSGSPLDCPAEPALRWRAGSARLFRCPRDTARHDARRCRCHRQPSRLGGRPCTAVSGPRTATCALTADAKAGRVAQATSTRIEAFHHEESVAHDRLPPNTLLRQSSSATPIVPASRCREMLASGWIPAPCRGCPERDSRGTRSASQSGVLRPTADRRQSEADAFTPVAFGSDQDEVAMLSADDSSSWRHSRTRMRNDMGSALLAPSG
jgi:hypothetical protein